MKASPGPVTRKKPAARSHMVGSWRKARVSALRRGGFLRGSIGESGLMRVGGSESSSSDARRSGRVP